MCQLANAWAARKRAVVPGLVRAGPEAARPPCSCARWGGVAWTISWSRRLRSSGVSANGATSAVRAASIVDLTRLSSGPVAGCHSRSRSTAARNRPSASAGPRGSPVPAASISIDSASNVHHDSQSISMSGLSSGGIARAASIPSYSPSAGKPGGWIAIANGTSSSSMAAAVGQ
jgi:hypothetical protein